MVSAQNIYKALFGLKNKNKHVFGQSQTLTIPGQPFDPGWSKFDFDQNNGLSLFYFKTNSQTSQIDILGTHHKLLTHGPIGIKIIL